MTKIASCEGSDSIPLHFILLDDADYALDERPLTLFVSKKHYSPERRVVEEAHFSSLEEARLYCQERYGLPASATWQDDPVFEQSFSFKYSVTHMGVAQPYLSGSPDGVIAFSVDKEQVLADDGKATPVISICGNREGLRRLAAMLLLCAECESLDPMFHMHLEGRPGVITDLPVTLRSPGYLQWWGDGRTVGEARDGAS